MRSLGLARRGRDPQRLRHPGGLVRRARGGRRLGGHALRVHPRAAAAPPRRRTSRCSRATTAGRSRCARATSGRPRSTPSSRTIRASTPRWSTPAARAGAREFSPPRDFSFPFRSGMPPNRVVRAPILHGVLVGLGLCLACVGPGGPAHSGDGSAAASPDWLAEAQRQLAAREYQASRQRRGPPGAQPRPQPAHLLRVGRASACTIAPRAGSPELLRALARGVSGAASALAALRAGRAGRGATRARVEIRRPGVVEWYVNSPAGLEQGFTLADAAGRRRSARDRDRGRRARVPSLRGDAVVFETATRRKLRYGELARPTRQGARSRRASSSHARSGCGSSSTTQSAAYPLAIDPLLTEDRRHATSSSDQADALIGVSVASAGDVNGDGYADVIVGRRASTRAEPTGGRCVRLPRQSRRASQRQTSPDRGRSESPVRTRRIRRFGASVAGAGDVNGDGYDDVIVGAPHYDAGETDEGAAFVFLGSATGIADGNSGERGATLESNQAGADFGCERGGRRRRERRRLRRRDRRRSDLRRRTDGRGRGVRVPRQRVGDRERQSRDGGGAARVRPGGRAVRRAASRAPAT